MNLISVLLLAAVSVATVAVLVAENPRFCTFLYNDEQYFANKC